MVAKHRFTSADVKDQEEHNLGDHHLHLRATVRVPLAYVLQVGLTATQGTQSRRPASRGAEWENSAAKNIRFTDAFNLCATSASTSRHHEAALLAHIRMHAVTSTCEEVFLTSFPKQHTAHLAVLSMRFIDSQATKISSSQA